GPRRASRERDRLRAGGALRPPRPGGGRRLLPLSARARAQGLDLRGRARCRPARGGRGAHGSARDRRSTSLAEVRAGRARRAALDRADAARRPRGLRRCGHREERGAPGHPHPGRLLNVDQAIAEALPGYRPRRLEVNEEGWDSVVAIVDREWVLRVARPSRFAALSFPEEAELTRALEPRLPLPIPVILRCTQEWALTRYIRGKPFSGRRGGAQLATFLRALHATHADLPEHDKEHDRERWVRHVLPRLEGDERRQAESLLDEHLGAGHPLVVGHTDLLAPHVLVQRRTISGVIDWSDARRADPAID